MSDIHFQNYLIQKTLEETRADALFDQYLEFNLSYFQQTLSNRVLIPSKDSTSSLTRADSRSDKKYRIAIVISRRARTINHVVLGFVENLTEIENVNFVPSIYNAEGNFYFLYDHILPQLLSNSYDLIYTIGLECTKAIAAFFATQKTKTPILFSGVHDLDLPIFDRQYVTGISSNHQSINYVNALLVTKPYTKKVGILYNPNECRETNNRYREEVTYLLQQRGIQTTLCSVERIEDVSTRAQALMSRVDTIMLLQDLMLSNSIQALSKPCNEKGVTLCSSYLYGIQDGAAFSFGYPEYVTGKAVAEKAAAILRDRVPINEIPINPPHTNYQILINSRTQYQQGLNLDLSHQLFARRGLIV